MRIIAGTLGSRLFEAPKGHRTHPMSDKVRGALFNMLGELDDLTVLDAFAGSGALSFEAVSRGATHVTAVESDRMAQKTIAANVETLGLQRQIKLIKTSTGAWLQTAKNPQFDVVLCDPPYDDLQPALLEKLTKTVKMDGIFALSWPGGQAAPFFDGLVQLNRRAYGDAQLVFYQKVA